MPKLRMRLSVSLDGFAAGPSQSRADPLGVGGTRLHAWAYQLKFFKKMMGVEGGLENASNTMVEAFNANLGATIMGRHMFGNFGGAWEPDWMGWWGNNPPFHHPVFVMTHHPRPPLAMEGGTTFHFVTDGMASALEQAKAAAKGQDINVGGGAKTARQFLSAKLVDELTVSVVPIVLGSGERLFEGLGTDLHGLQLANTVATPEVVHLVLKRG